ncbi:MAG: ABC transporter permease [Anaerolineae bacterium]
MDKQVSVAKRAGADLPIPRHIDRRQILIPAAMGGIMGLVLLIGGLTTPNYLSAENLIAILQASAITGIAAIGMTFITLSGNFVSLSVSQTAVMAATIFAAAMQFGWGTALAFVAVMLACILVGGLQGSIVALGLNPIVTTLGAGAAIIGLTQVITDNKTIQVGTIAADWIGRSMVLGVPSQTWFFVILVVVLSVVLHRTRFGRETVLIGANRATARSSGINVGLTIITTFVLSAMVAGLVGIIVVTKVAQAKTTMFDSLGIETIAAVLVGGTSIQGGDGSIIRTAFGAVLISLVTNLMLLQDLQFGVRMTITGLIVVAAVLSFHKLRENIA